MSYDPFDFSLPTAEAPTFEQFQQDSTQLSEAANFWDEMRWQQDLNLKSDHIEAGLDARDLAYLDTPTDFSRPTVFRTAGGYSASID